MGQIQQNHSVDEKITRAILYGDLSMLSDSEKALRYKALCDAVGLNYQTMPFQVLALYDKKSGRTREVLYATKAASDQLRQLHNVSITIKSVQKTDKHIIVHVEAVNGLGRRDEDVAIVELTDMLGNYGNCYMKAITKAKRRVTLSISGLGMLDETEIETIPEAEPLPGVKLPPAPKPFDRNRAIEFIAEARQLIRVTAMQETEYEHLSIEQINALDDDEIKQIATVYFNHTKGVRK